MKLKTLFILLLFSTSVCFAQQENQRKPDPLPDYWLVYVNHVKAPKLDEFESKMQEISKFVENQMEGNKPIFSTPWFVFSNKNSALYSMIFPMESYGDIDKIISQRKKLSQLQQFASLDQDLLNTLMSWDCCVMASRHDLSYFPQNSQSEANDDRYYLIETVQVKPGTQQFFEGILQKWVEGFKSQNAQYRWNTYQITIGNDQPTYMIIAGSQDLQDFKKRMVVSLEVGERDKLFSGASFGIVTKYSWGIDTYRPNLSYLPKNNGSEMNSNSQKPPCSWSSQQSKSNAEGSTNKPPCSWSSQQSK